MTKNICMGWYLSVVFIFDFLKHYVYNIKHGTSADLRIIDEVALIPLFEQLIIRFICTTHVIINSIFKNSVVTKCNVKAKIKSFYNIYVILN